MYEELLEINFIESLSFKYLLDNALKESSSTDFNDALLLFCLQLKNIRVINNDM